MLLSTGIRIGELVALNVADLDLEKQQIQLAFVGGAFFVRYFDHRFPVAPRTYGRMLGHRLDELQRKLGAENPALLEFQSIVTSLERLPGQARAWLPCRPCCR